MNPRRTENRQLSDCPNYSQHKLHNGQNRPRYLLCLRGQLSILSWLNDCCSDILFEAKVFIRYPFYIHCVAVMCIYVWMNVHKEYVVYFSVQRSIAQKAAEPQLQSGHTQDISKVSDVEIPSHCHQLKELIEKYADVLGWDELKTFQLLSRKWFK